MEKSFETFLQTSRKELSKVVLQYQPNEHLKLRTEVDNFLIPFDQAVDKLNKASEFQELVELTRSKQKMYFKTKRKEYLYESKKLESQVDKFLQNQKEQNQSPKLF